MARRTTQDDRVTALADLADLAYFEVDADRNVVAMSPAMERLTGFSAVRMIGRSCLDVHRCETCLQGCGVFEHGHVRNIQLKLYRADGSDVWVRKSGRVLRDAHGKVTGALEVLRQLSPHAPARPAPPPEADRIREALVEVRYNRERAARSLGMSRSTLWRKMREYGL